MKASTTSEQKISTATTRNTMSYKTVTHNKENVITRINLDDVSIQEELSLGINYLYSFKSTDGSAKGFIEASNQIMSL